MQFAILSQLILVLAWQKSIHAISPLRLCINFKRQTIYAFTVFFSLVEPIILPYIAGVIQRKILELFTSVTVQNRPVCKRPRSLQTPYEYCLSCQNCFFWLQIICTSGIIWHLHSTLPHPPMPNSLPSWKDPAHTSRNKTHNVWSRYPGAVVRRASPAGEALLFVSFYSRVRHALLHMPETVDVSNLLSGVVGRLLRYFAAGFRFDTGLVAMMIVWNVDGVGV